MLNRRGDSRFDLHSLQVTVAHSAPCSDKRRVDCGGFEMYRNQPVLPPTFCTKLLPCVVLESVSCDLLPPAVVVVSARDFVAFLCCVHHKLCNLVVIDGERAYEGMLPKLVRHWPTVPLRRGDVHFYTATKVVSISFNHVQLLIIFVVINHVPIN